MEQDSSPSPKKSSLKTFVPFLAGILVCVAGFLLFQLLSGSLGPSPTHGPSSTPDTSITDTTTPGADATATSAPDTTVTPAVDSTPGGTPPATSAPTATAAMAATATPASAFVPDYLPGAPNTKGNTSSSLVNGGHVATQGNWIYYPLASVATDSDLYKIRTDGTGKTLITTDDAKCINVVGDWIYYENLSDGRKLWKIRTDGTLRTKISDEAVDFVQVVGDWIYYSVQFTSTTGEFRKCRTDGSVRRLLAADDVYSPFLWGNSFYYCNLSDSGHIWTITTEGNGHARVVPAGGDPIWSLNVTDRGIFYTDSVEHKIWNLQTDGTGRTAVGFPNVKGFGLVASGDFVYYSKYLTPDEGCLFKVSLSTLVVTRLTYTQFSMSSSLVGDWIYYQNGGYGYPLYRIRTDGSGAQKFG